MQAISPRRSFTYDASEKTFTWNIGTISDTELSLTYYVQLNESARNTIGTNSYPTNDYAYLYYNNYLGELCRKTYPVPTMPWGKAQVSYYFYLVNASGQPVNTSGQVVSFLNAAKVSTTVTQTFALGSSVTLTASTLKPAYLSSYSLYNSNAAYTVSVNSSGTGGSNSWTGASTYANTTGSWAVGPGSSSSTTNSYISTSAAFALVWNAELANDSVVIDYGLPVDINVVSNDSISGSVNGIYDTETVIGRSTTHNDNYVMTDLSLPHGTAAVLSASAGSNTTVRYTPNSMSFSAPDVFCYESAVSYYVSGALTTGYMYAKVTVIPATTVYYEDNGGFISYTNGNVDSWSIDGTSSTASQALDAVGDANANVYGYDPAYGNCTTFGMGSAHKVNVSAADTTAPTASFTFTGTGFDIIALTNNASGTIVAHVVSNTTGVTYDKWIPVDTYYGYSCTGESGSYVWTATDSGDDNALYQIPVLKATGLVYASYTVTIVVGYNKFFDHTGNDSYNFWLDGVRIYSPASGNATATAAYTADGENTPAYAELRDLLLAANALSNTSSVTGTVFIDGISAVASVSDYAAYGPNNEIYLQKNQAIAFQLKANGTDTSGVSLQLGAKLVNGNHRRADHFRRNLQQRTDAERFRCADAQDGERHVLQARRHHLDGRNKHLCFADDRPHEYDRLYHFPDEPEADRRYLQYDKGGQHKERGDFRDLNCGHGKYAARCAEC
jgi:hypothetical protein